MIISRFNADVGVGAESMFYDDGVTAVDSGVDANVDADVDTDADVDALVLTLSLVLTLMLMMMPTPRLVLIIELAGVVAASKARLTLGKQTWY